MANVARLWRVGGWLGLALTLVVSLIPPPLEAGTGHGDKVAHLLGYALLMLWWAQLIRVRRTRLAAALIAFGLGIEGLQGLTPTRLADPLDALANTVGIALGWLAASRLPNLPERLAALPGRPR